MNKTNREVINSSAMGTCSRCKWQGGMSLFWFHHIDIGKNIEGKQDFICTFSDEITVAPPLTLWQRFVSYLKDIWQNK